MCVRAYSGLLCVVVCANSLVSHYQIKSPHLTHTHTHTHTPSIQATSFLGNKVEPNAQCILHSHTYPTKLITSLTIPHSSAVGLAALAK